MDLTNFYCLFLLPEYVNKDNSERTYTKVAVLTIELIITVYQ